MWCLKGSSPAAAIKDNHLCRGAWQDRCDNSSFVRNPQSDIHLAKTRGRQMRWGRGGGGSTWQGGMRKREGGRKECCCWVLGQDRSKYPSAFWLAVNIWCHEFQVSFLKHNVLDAACILLHKCIIIGFFWSHTSISTLILTHLVA